MESPSALQWSLPRVYSPLKLSFPPRLPFAKIWPFPAPACSKANPASKTAACSAWHAIAQPACQLAGAPSPSRPLSVSSKQSRWQEPGNEESPRHVQTPKLAREASCLLPLVQWAGRTENWAASRLREATGTFQMKVAEEKRTVLISRGWRKKRHTMMLLSEGIWFPSSEVELWRSSLPSSAQPSLSQAGIFPAPQGPRKHREEDCLPGDRKWWR